MHFVFDEVFYAVRSRIWVTTGLERMQNGSPILFTASAWSRYGPSHLFTLYHLRKRTPRLLRRPVDSVRTVGVEYRTQRGDVRRYVFECFWSHLRHQRAKQLGKSFIVDRYLQRGSPLRGASLFRMIVLVGHIAVPPPFIVSHIRYGPDCSDGSAAPGKCVVALMLLCVFKSYQTGSSVG